MSPELRKFGLLDLDSHTSIRTLNHLCLHNGDIIRRLVDGSDPAVAVAAVAGRFVPVEEEAEFELDQPLCGKNYRLLKQNVLTRTIVQNGTIISYKVLKRTKMSVCV